MRTSLRAFPLLAAGLAMADLDSHPFALSWPVGSRFSCDQTSTDPFHEFGYTEHVDSTDAQGRPLSLRLVVVNRRTKVDSTWMSIAWTPQLPVEKNRFTGQPYSFPLRIQYRTINSGGVLELDTLNGLWDPQRRSLTYTSTSDLPPPCGWQDSLTFDEQLRPVEQTACGGSGSRIRSVQRFHYEGSDRHPRSSATITDSARGETDSVWAEGPIEHPTRSTWLHTTTQDIFGTKSIHLRREITDYDYGPDGKLREMKTSTLQDTALAGLTGTWFTWAANGIWNKLEGFEVEIGTTRDSLWWSASCTDDPSGVRLAPRTIKSAPAHLEHRDGIWHLVSREPVAGPVEWISARGTRRVVATPTSESVVRLDLPRGAGPGWIRFATRAGERTLPAPVFAP